MKNILMIGGSSGIGFSIAQLLQQENKLFIASRTDTHFESSNVTYIPFDAAIDTLDTIMLPEIIDALVYCPGSINLKPFKNIKPEAFIEDLNINFIGMVKVLQAILPKLTASKHGSVLLFSSVAATIGMPFHTSIAASKGAIEGFAKALAAEYAPNLRVNVIAPSLTETALAEKFLNNDVKKERSADLHPLKRFGQPEDIANMAVYLLSDKASWITGQIFHIDGGMSALSINK